jgi:hypothetical protein
MTYGDGMFESYQLADAYLAGLGASPGYISLPMIT